MTSAAHAIKQETRTLGQRESAMRLQPATELDPHIV